MNDHSLKRLVELTEKRDELKRAQTAFEGTLLTVLRYLHDWPHLSPSMQDVADAAGLPLEAIQDKQRAMAEKQAEANRRFQERQYQRITAGGKA